MSDKHWSAVITRRGDNVRIISVRRSRDEEIAIDESQDIVNSMRPKTWSASLI
jgi:hypothetical protein